MHAKTMLSSIITSARPLNCTCSWKMACYRQSSAPDRWRWLPAVPAVLTFLLTGEPAHFDTERCKPVGKLLACCSASNSVGAINATCCRGQSHATRRGRRPAFYRNLIALHQTHHRHIQRHIALDLPTTRACAPVGLNGKAARSLFSACHWRSAAGHENAVLRHVS